VDPRLQAHAELVPQGEAADNQSVVDEGLRVAS